jgi:phosphohistidine swiveling domain-containing protein
LRHAAVKAGAVARGDFDRSRVGGKAASLARVRDAGVSVPDWVVLESRLFEEFMRRRDLRRAVDRALEGVSLGGMENAAKQIEQHFSPTSLDADVRRLVDQARRRLGSRTVAVRSSAIEEDGAQRSFAGQFCTELNVTEGDSLYASIVRCWSSAYSARALQYRMLHRLPLHPIGIAVILQAMISAEKSGVVFTRNPLRLAADELSISAVFGLGEGLVSGGVDADTIVLERSAGGIRSATIGEKERRLVAREGGGCTYEVIRSGRAGLALEAREIEQIRETALKIEALCGRPQDIEWALAEGRLWVLQSRDITGIDSSAHAVCAASGHFRIWDNSNIIESFGDITSPLTFTVAQHVYERVFREYYRYCGVPRREIERSERWLRNMLGYFNGHVYYNLLNWYQMLRPLPFYSRLQRRMFERSIGTTSSIDPALADHIPLFADCERKRIVLAGIRALVAFRCAWLWLAVGRNVARFLRRFDAAFASLDVENYEAFGGPQAYERFCAFEREILPLFGQMIAIDNTVGITLGLLHLLTQRWLPHAEPWFLWEMVQPRGATESAEPAAELQRLARAISKDALLVDLLRRTPPAEAYSAACAAAPRDFVACVDRYIERFGYRSLNELKLEAPTMRDDKSIFFRMLNSAVEATRANEGPHGQRGAGQTYLENHLRGWRRTVYEGLRRRAARALSARESVRFRRTCSFGLVKRMVRGMGRALEREGALESSGDVYYLRLEELRGYFCGTLGESSLAPLAALRRAREREYSGIEAPSRFTTNGMPYGERLSESVLNVVGEAAPDGSLRGMPCCAGSAEDMVRVVKDPGDAGAGILVGYRTDPGWVGLLAAASGLLIERGSPLTHLVIVARELGVPTIVQIPELTRRLQTGMRVRMNGATGEIKIIDSAQG